MKSKIIYSKRKTLAITVNDMGEVIIRAPRGTCIVDANKYMLKHQDWIIKQQKKIKERQNKLYSLDYDPEKLSEYKKKANILLSKKTDEIGKTIAVKYKKFRLSNAKKRWGTCNSSKTVSINWRLLFAPERLQEYVIIHELAHLKHMNHSKRFWGFVEKHIPDYKKRKKELKEYEYLLLI